MRTNITLPRKTFDDFGRLAENFFQGNRSQFLRSSGYFYGHFLETGTTLELEELKREQLALAGKINRMELSVEKMFRSVELLIDNLNPGELLEGSRNQSFADARIVRELLKESEEMTASESGIIEQTNLPPRRVSSALEVLLDEGMVEMSSTSGDNNYRITG